MSKVKVCHANANINNTRVMPMPTSTIPVMTIPRLFFLSETAKLKKCDTKF